MDGPVSVSSLLCPPPNNTRKRSHNQISDLSRQSPCSAHEAESSITSAQAFNLNNLRMPAIHRFRGDGVDMRTPVMSTAQNPPDATIIDLTTEPPSPSLGPDSALHATAGAHPPRRPTSRPQRGPRYERDIIGANEEQPTVDLRESSPDVQFISTRPLVQNTNGGSNRQEPRLMPTPRSPTVRHANPSEGRGFRLPDLAHAMRNNIGSIGIAMMGGRRLMSGDDLVAINGLEFRPFEAPELNFNLQGFNLDQPSRPVQQPRLPTYEKPPQARAGFTRDLNEDDMLVCPNCDDELGVGDNDVERQVWLVKTCGHVYCGECAKYRSTSSKNAALSSRRIKPFKKCVVEDCSRSVSKSSMIQVYL